MCIFKKILIALMLSSVFVSSFSFADVVIIVHPDNTNVMSKSDVKRIFLGKNKFFPDKSKAIPVIQEATAISNDFNDKVLNKSSAQLKAFWSKLIFTGTGTLPGSALVDAPVIDLVGNNPNIIGYIDSSTVVSGIKVVVSS